MRPASPLRYILVFWVLFFSGCAAYQTYRQVAEFERPAEYERFFELVDHAVKEAGMRNVSDFAVTGFPYLRSNRFLAGLKSDLNNNARRQQWVLWMQKLDLAARRKEILTLPAEDLKDLTRKLGEPADRNLLIDRATFLSDRLLAHDCRSANFADHVRALLLSGCRGSLR